MATDGPNGTISNRDLLIEFNRQMDGLRQATSEARHAQTDKITALIGGIELRMDARLKAIELDMAASAPTTLGPRLQKIERWQGALDENEEGGAPRRISAMEARWDRVDGAILALKAAVAILSVVATVEGIVVTVLALT